MKCYTRYPKKEVAPLTGRMRKGKKPSSGRPLGGKDGAFLLDYK